MGFVLSVNATAILDLLSFAGSLLLSLTMVINDVNTLLYSFEPITVIGTICISLFEVDEQRSMPGLEGVSRCLITAK